MQRPGLQRIVKRDCNHMDRRAFMPQPYVATPFAGSPHIRFVPTRESDGYRIHRAAISCRFKRNQLIFNVVHLHQPGSLRDIFKMERDRLQNIGSKSFPSLSFRENRIA